MVRRAPRSNLVGWLLLTAAALVIGLLVGLAGAVATPESLVPSPPRRADRGNEPARIAPIGNGSAVNAVVVEAPDPVTRERAIADTVAARVRFRLQRVGMPRTHYIGTVRLFTDEIEQSLMQVTNCDPVDFVVPRVARRLRCEAPGCSPVDLELPPSGPGILALGEITFGPDSSITFVVVGLPAEYDGEPSFEASSSDYECAGRVQNWRPGATAQFAFLCGRAISWQAVFRGQHALGFVSGREPALQAGEHRTIVVDVSALRPVVCQVIGPSPELLPHLVVQVQAASAGSVAPVPVVLDATGRFTLAGGTGGEFSLVVHAGEGELRESRRGEILELRPRSPLLGLVLRGAGGVLLPFSCNQQPPAKVFVAERDQLRSLFVSGDGVAPRRIRPADLPLDRDLVDLASVPATSLGELVVEVHGEPLEPMRRATLQVLRADGTLLTSSLARRSTKLGAIEPGTYDLRWCVDGELGDWVARGVSVAAGGLRQLQAEWPVSMVWTGEVAGQAGAEAGRRFHSVRFGHAPGLFGGHWVKVEPEGAFRLSLPPGGALAEDVDLRCVMMTVRAEVVSIDRERRHVVLRPPVGLRWVDLVVAPDAGGPWAASLAREGREEPWMMEWSREQRPILVPPGVVLGGALWSTADAGDLLAWFAVDGSTPRVAVGRAPGRSLEFRNGGANGRSLGLVGPRGQFFGCGTLTGTPLRCFVPDGTRGFVVVDEAHPHGERQEQSIPPGDFVIVR